MTTYGNFGVWVSAGDILVPVPVLIPLHLLLAHTEYKYRLYVSRLILRYIDIAPDAVGWARGLSRCEHSCSVSVLQQCRFAMLVWALKDMQGEMLLDIFQTSPSRFAGLLSRLQPFISHQCVRSIPIDINHTPSWSKQMAKKTSIMQSLRRSAKLYGKGQFNSETVKTVKKQKNQKQQHVIEIHESIKFFSTPWWVTNMRPPLVYLGICRKILNAPSKATLKSFSIALHCKRATDGLVESRAQWKENVTEMYIFSKLFC